MIAPYVSDPVKMAQFRQDLGTEMALENLRIHDVALSPAQIAQYYNQHKTDFALPEQTLTTTVVSPNTTDAATAAALLRQNTPPDVIGRQPRLRVVGIGGYRPDMQILPTAFKRQTNDWAAHAGVGAVHTFQAGPFYVTLRVTRRLPAVVPPLGQVRDEVERAARLAAAPAQTEELARLYQSAKPSFNSDKYAAYFASFDQYPLGSQGKKTADAH